jgi:hypothetical protein
MKTQSQRGGWTENAALLYYQAFLLYEKPEDTLKQMLGEFRAGEIGSNEAIRAHIEKNRRAIEYAVKAASVVHCDWGYDYSEGIDLTLPNLFPVRHLAWLLSTEVRLLTEQGDYRTALDRCVTMHQMALHAVDKAMITYLMGISFGAVANRRIQAVLAVMPGDVDMLQGLKDQLSQIQAAFPPLENAVTQEGQIWTALMHKEKAQVALQVLEPDFGELAGRPYKQRIETGDEAFFERNRTHWLQSIATFVDVLKSGQPYPQIYAQLGELEQKQQLESLDNPDATFTALLLSAAHRIYLLTTRFQTHFNAVLTAIDLYIIKVNTGSLPDTLPAGMPLDLYSGQPFEYEKAPGHFTLRCRAKEDPVDAEVKQYEFKFKP